MAEISKERLDRLERQIKLHQFGVGMFEQYEAEALIKIARREAKLRETMEVFVRTKILNPGAEILALKAIAGEF